MARHAGESIIAALQFEIRVADSAEDQPDQREARGPFRLWRIAGSQPCRRPGGLKSFRFYSSNRPDRRVLTVVKFSGSDVVPTGLSGHFYFALTRRNERCGSKVIMSPLGKVEMSS